MQTSSSDAKLLNAGYCLIFVPFCAAYDFAKTSECFAAAAFCLVDAHIQRCYDAFVVFFQICFCFNFFNYCLVNF